MFTRLNLDLRPATKELTLSNELTDVTVDKKWPVAVPCSTPVKKFVSQVYSAPKTKFQIILHPPSPQCPRPHLRSLSYIHRPHNNLAHIFDRFPTSTIPTMPSHTSSIASFATCFAFLRLQKTSRHIQPNHDSESASSEREPSFLCADAAGGGSEASRVLECKSCDGLFLGREGVLFLDAPCWPCP